MELRSCMRRHYYSTHRDGNREFPGRRKRLLEISLLDESGRGLGRFFGRGARNGPVRGVGVFRVLAVARWVCLG